MGALTKPELTNPPQPSPEATLGTLKEIPRQEHVEPSHPHWQKGFLEMSTHLGGLPALTIMVLGTLDIEDHWIIGIASGIALAISLLLFFSQFFKKHQMLAIVPWGLTFISMFVLVVFVLPARTKNDSKLLARTWLDWQGKLEQSAAKCEPKDEQKDEQCLKKELTPVLANRPKPLHPSEDATLASDVVAGQLLLANDNIRNVLNRRLGVGGRFLGSGFSEPVNENEVASARTAEYFVPNLPDTEPHLWFWKLQPSQLMQQAGADRKHPTRKPLSDVRLIDVLLKIPPENHADFAQNWNEWIERDHTGPGDPHPALVRFAWISPDKYSGCLGRPDASRVFMNGLGEVKDKPLTDAAKNSGYNSDVQSDHSNYRLLVWVFVPHTEGVVFPATWNNVIAHYGEWTTAKTCAQAK